MFKTITISNIKGGSGKTTLTALLASELSKKSPVLLIDADPQMSLTNWALHQLEGDAQRQAIAKIKNHNLLSVFRSETTLRACAIEVNPNLHFIASHVMLEKANEEFKDVIGREMFIKSAISDLNFSLTNDNNSHITSHNNGKNGKNGKNGNILIDTAGDIGLLAIMSLAACQTSLIPVATNVMSIQTLGLSLQRVEQVQRSLNSGLNKVMVVPSLFTRTRKSHQQCLEELKKDYSELLPLDKNNEVVTILNRAEIENFIHESQHNLPRNSDVMESIETIIEYLD